MRRGDLVTVSAQGDYGKARPAIVVQSDALDGAESVLVALLTSTLSDAPLYRLTIEANARNGLQKPSQVMVDKVLAYPRAKCGPSFGHLEPQDLIALNSMLLVMLGLAD
ncbi:type II toxin-antitoxin system PemK/MazF family toxin [Acidisoma silvae]|uniref:Type II toxin-antitoxin system PemK/MazF family toxin n=1 Tax=Acidisoma silvae TaxID=2802396 RepID=A0A963YS49_9PROT|nr:type II toxin-antitoxin system PemK/MazF family toxin [Acidisoma silvae]MCB8875981.1 type II toxin-antitoxin system PemK/MazF family toxin [Acidisoma silvae]